MFIIACLTFYRKVSFLCCILSSILHALNILSILTVRYRVRGARLNVQAHAQALSHVAGTSYCLKLNISSINTKEKLIVPEAALLTRGEFQPTFDTESVNLMTIKTNRCAKCKSNTDRMNVDDKKSSHLFHKFTNLLEYFFFRNRSFLRF